MTCEKTKRFFAKAKFITLEIFDYHQKFFQCCLGIKHSSFPKRNSLMPATPLPLIRKCDTKQILKSEWHTQSFVHVMHLCNWTTCKTERFQTSLFASKKFQAYFKTSELVFVCLKTPNQFASSLGVLKLERTNAVLYKTAAFTTSEVKGETTLRYNLRRAIKTWLSFHERLHLPSCSNHPVMQSLTEIHQKASLTMKSQKPPNDAINISSMHLNKSNKL